MSIKSKCIVHGIQYISTFHNTKQLKLSMQALIAMPLHNHCREKSHNCEKNLMFLTVV